MQQGRPQDEIDRVVEFWRTENPELDVTTKTLAMRLRRAAHHLERAMRRELATSGVEFWEVEVLLSLKRATGYRRSAGDLLRESQVTSGAITNRVDRLQQRGWVRRDVDPDDRRQVLVTLTADGVTEANRVIATKNEAEQRLFAGVDRRVLERITNDLRTLLMSVDGPADQRDDTDRPH